MGIWEILGIEPTMDKRKIKRAYAERTRTVHPEEKPEEFRVLYEAYQRAMKLAEVPKAGRPYRMETAGVTRQKKPEEQETAQPERAERAERAEAKKPEEARPEEQKRACSDSLERMEAKKPETAQPDREEMHSYFEAIKSEQEEKIAFFREKWKMIGFENWKSEVKEWWKNYLKTEDFREIQWHPQLLGFLTEELEKPVQYEYEIRLFLWEAYGFQEKGTVCNGDLQKLRKALREQENRQLEARRLARDKKEKKFYNRMFLIALGLGCFFWGGTAILVKNMENDNRGSRQDAVESCAENIPEGPEEERDLVKAYMEERYPGTEFSEPVWVEERTVSGDVYEMHSLSHPDITFEAMLLYDLADSAVRGIKEEYGQLLTERYAKEYGLECFWLYRPENEWPDLPGEYTGVSVLCYQDAEKLDEFCDTVIRMFREQEELQNLAAVGICKANVCYPDLLVGGGSSEYDLGDGQFYRPWEMESGRMQEMIREGCQKYMVYFEPWGLPLEQCLKWRAEYEEKGGEISRDSDSSFSVTLSAEGGEPCEIYIPVYVCDVYDGPESECAWMILAGDAYYYLLSEGVTVEARKGEHGFWAEKDGEVFELGRSAKENIEWIDEFIPH